MEKILEAPTGKKAREPYFQMIRGLCICAVILIHCYTSERNDLENYYLIIIRNLENFAVGVFIFLAGYFAKPMDSGRGIKDRLKKLLIPFILWGLFFEMVSRDFNLIKLTYHILSGRSSAQMYYIIVLIELMIITPLLWKATESRRWSILILAITPIYLVCFSILHYHFLQMSDWIGRDFIAWLMYYYIGMLLQRYGWTKKSNVLLFILFAAAYVLSVIESVYALRVMNTIDIAVSQLKLSCMLYIVAVICLVMNNRSVLKNPLQKTLAYIGDRSYGVFYVHTFILRCVTWLMKKAGVIDLLNIPAIQIIQFTSVLSLSLFTIWLTHRIDKSGKYCKLIGF